MPSRILDLYCRVNGRETGRCNHNRVQYCQKLAKNLSVYITVDMNDRKVTLSHFAPSQLGKFSEAAIRNYEKMALADVLSGTSNSLYCCRCSTYLRLKERDRHVDKSSSQPQETCEMSKSFKKKIERYLKGTKHGGSGK